MHLPLHFLNFQPNVEQEEGNILAQGSSKHASKSQARMRAKKV
jgi:hypothetical protein